MHVFNEVIYLHGGNNIDDVNTRNFTRDYIHPISNRIRIIAENVLVLLGLCVGAIRYLPIVIKRKIQHGQTRHEYEN